MSLFDYLMSSRSKQELAKELAASVKEAAALIDKVHELEYQLFWQKSAGVTPAKAVTIKEYTTPKLINDNDVLWKDEDIIVTTYRKSDSGAGKNHNSCMIHHLPTGIVVKSESRINADTTYRARMEAFKKLTLVLQSQLEEK